MAENLKTRIQDDTKAAMRAQDKPRLGVIRLILAALKQKEVDDRIILSDEQIIEILDKMLKQRRDSLEQFLNANRKDLADQESYEIGVIQEYMPKALSEAELEQIIKTAISTTGATSAKDMGNVMAHIKPQIQYRADVRVVSENIKKRLSL